MKVDKEKHDKKGKTKDKTEDKTNPDDLKNLAIASEKWLKNSSTAPAEDAPRAEPGKNAPGLATPGPLPASPAPPAVLTQFGWKTS